MKRNRYLLCLLICGFLLYNALPKLNIYSEGMEGIFAITWLAFALIVMAGNLTAWLYSPRKTKVSRNIVQERKKSRAFSR